MAETSSSHVRLVVRLENGKTLEFGPGTRYNMCGRGREMFEAGLTDADYFVGDELIVYGTQLPGERDEPPGEIAETPANAASSTATSAQPRRPSRPESVPGARASDRVLTLADAGDLCKTLIGNAVEQANLLLDGAAKRSIEASDAILKQQRAADSHLVQQAEELRKMVSSMNATAAEERLALFRIQSAEEQLAERRARDEYARQLAIAEASKPDGVTMIVEIAAAFLGRLAANTSTNYQAINLAPAVPAEES